MVLIGWEKMTKKTAAPSEKEKSCYPILSQIKGAPVFYRQHFSSGGGILSLRIPEIIVPRGKMIIILC